MRPNHSEIAPPETALLRSLAIQLRVVHALFLREVITRYGRHGIGVLWIVAEPMLFTLGVAALWYFAKANAYSNIPIVAFAITGYSSVLMWRNAANRCAKAIEPNLSLMYHRNVKVIDVFISRVLLEWVGATASIVLLTLFFVGVGAMQWPHDPWPIIAGWFLLAWFSLALGFVIGAVSERSELIERTWHVVTYLLFPLSGAMFMVHWLPPAAQSVVLKIPMVHGVELLREGYFGSSFKAHYDIGYMAVFCAVLTLLGLAKLREISRTVMPE